MLVNAVYFAISMALPSPSEITYQKAHMQDDRRIGIIISNVVCFVLATAAVILRFISRRLAGTKHGWDDWWMLAALVKNSQNSTVISKDNMTNSFAVYIHRIYH